MDYEPYTIRRFNPNRSSDTQKLKDIDRHPTTLQFMYPPRPISNKDLDEWIRMDESAADLDNQWLPFAICDKDNNPIGYVNYYPCDTKSEFEKQISIPDGALILEVSYAKSFPKWPKGKHYIKFRTNLDTKSHKGVAESGLRQTMNLLANREGIISKQSSLSSRKIYITAFTESENTYSEHVLEKCGFTKLPSQINDGKSACNAWVKKIN